MTADLREVLRSANLAVYDNVLSPAELRELLHWAERLEYESVHKVKWTNVWRMHDGAPLRGPTGFFLRSADNAGSKSGPLSDPRGKLQPLSDRQGKLQPFVSKLRRIALESCPDILGSWASFSVTPWIYPAGSGLSLHRDSYPYKGSFTFYFHPEWKLHWGGWLLSLAEQRGEFGELNISVFDDSREADLVASEGYGRWILPKPNRLVMIAPHTRHLISRVDQNAGSCLRLSLAGFFSDALAEPANSRFGAPSPRLGSPWS